jgi:phosphate transport system substrate-binding protein
MISEWRTNRPRIWRIYADFCFYPRKSASSAKSAVYLLCILLLFAGCEGVAVSTPAPTTITIVGSAAMQRALRGLTDEFSRQNPNVLFSIRSGGSTIGEEEVAQGEADIGATTLPPPDVATAGVELMRTPVGINGLAIVVHPSNSVGDLSLVQLSDIFAGRVLDWQALGSDNGEIQLVSREDGSGSRRLFEERVMGDDRVSLTAVVMPSSADVAAYVAKRPDAIGYLSRGEVAGLFAADADADAAAPQPATTPAAWPRVKIVRVEGQLPTVENLAEQRYALIQPLYLITRGAPAGWPRRFIDFVLSPAGQAIIAQYHAPIR